jgi:hypothetical protein
VSALGRKRRKKTDGGWTDFGAAYDAFERHARKAEKSGGGVAVGANKNTKAMKRGQDNAWKAFNRLHGQAPKKKRRRR